MSELKPCPFCGGLAEMNTERNFPIRERTQFKTKEDAENWLSGIANDFPVAQSGIYLKERHYYKKGKVIKWCAFVQYKGFIPRCKNTKCLGHSNFMFHTEKEAAEKWNRRADHV
jgi:hypothetical protein